MLELRASVRGLLVVAGLILGAFAVVRLWPVLLLVLIAVLLTMALMPAVDALVRRRVPRALAVIALVLTILAGTIGLAAFLVPSMISEFREVNDRLPEYAEKVEELLSGAGLEVDLSGRAESVDWSKYASGQVGLVAGQQALTMLLAVVSMVVMTAYMLLEAPQIGRFFAQFLDAARQRDASKLFTAMCKAVGGYFRGQLITSTAIAVFTFVLLVALGVRNPLAFAVLAGIADIVPLVGVFFAILPPVAAALQQSSTTAIVVLVALLVYQQFEDRLLVPYVYGRTLRLSPLVVLISVLFGAQLLGIIGVLLALPIAAIGRVLVDYWLQRRRGSAPAAQGWSAEDAPFAGDRRGDCPPGQEDGRTAEVSAPARARPRALVLRGWRISVEAVRPADDAAADRAPA